MIWLDPNELRFPDPREEYFPNGPIAWGGDLSPARILLAYRLGIFPWYDPGDEILWWCPDPRFVLFPNELKVFKSMRKILKAGIFSFTENQNFREVIENCMNIRRNGQDGTWLSPELVDTMVKLHETGIAKSVEVWQDGLLVGGFYGLQIGNVFCGESMFSKVSNASKAGFLQFVLKNKDAFSLIDCQNHTPHLESLGARMIPKNEFLHYLPPF